MGNFRDLAVERICAHDLAAECLPDRLVAKAYAEDGCARGSPRGEVEAQSVFVWRAWAGRQHDGFRLQRQHICAGNSVVAMHDNVCAQPSQIMEKVEGEAVIIVDQDDHVPPLWQGFKVPPKGGQAAAFFDGYWPRLAALAKRRASSAARNKAFALLMHSCCSKSGSLSATMPAPA